MKVKIRVPKKETQNLQKDGALTVCSSDVSIDLVQVLAANQALLKNLSKKMERLELKIHSLENTIETHHKELAADKPVRALLMAPAEKVVAWHPVPCESEEKYFSQFSWWDRWFYPERMRRN